MTSEGLRRFVFDGSIPAVDSEIHKRPYHKNCGCALHHRPGKCKECNHGKTSISYKTRQAWSESCLVAAASGCSWTSNLPVKKVAWES